MAFPRSAPLLIGAIGLAVLIAAALLRPSAPQELLPARQAAPPDAQRPSAPPAARAAEPMEPETDVKEVQMEPGEARVTALVAQIKAARTPFEWNAGLQLLPAAGPPDAVWEGLRTLLREGSPEMAPAVADKMIEVNPPQAVTTLAGIMSSPEPGRQRAAVHALGKLAKSSPSLAGPAVAALTHAGLKSPDRAVRKAVLEALVEVATPAEAPAIREYAAGETDRELRELAERAAAR